MFLIIEIADGIVLAVVVLGWWREIGALALVAAGLAVAAGVAATLSWQAAGVVGAAAVVAWVWRRKLLAWAGVDDAPATIADKLAVPDVAIQPVRAAPLPGSLRSLRRP